MPELSFEWFSDPHAWGALLTLSLGVEMLNLRTRARTAPAPASEI